MNFVKSKLARTTIGLILFANVVILFQNCSSSSFSPTAGSEFLKNNDSGVIANPTVSLPPTTVSGGSDSTSTDSSSNTSDSSSNSSNTGSTDSSGSTDSNSNVGSTNGSTNTESNTDSSTTTGNTNTETDSGSNTNSGSNSLPVQCLDDEAGRQKLRDWNNQGRLVNLAIDINGVTHNVVGYQQNSNTANVVICQLSGNGSSRMIKVGQSAVPQGQDEVISWSQLEVLLAQ